MAHHNSLDCDKEIVHNDQFDMLAHIPSSNLNSLTSRACVRLFHSYVPLAILRLFE